MMVIAAASSTAPPGRRVVDTRLDRVGLVVPWVAAAVALLLAASVP